jgi:hypothetical protein
MKYELWMAENSYSFFPEDNESARRLLKPAAKHIETIEADTWEDACVQKHIFLGWKPYKPMEAK